MSGWDTLRAKQRGDHGARELPTCSRCGRTSVLEVCPRCTGDVADVDEPQELALDLGGDT